MFKRAKSKPSQRNRESSPETERGNEAITTGDESPSTLAAKLKSKSKKAKKSRLSFGGDDEETTDGEVFKLKKSVLSQRIHAQVNNMASGTNFLTLLTRNLPANLDQASISTAQGSPIYDQAYLKQLKASTPSSRQPVSEDGDISYDADISMDLGEDGAEVQTAIPAESSIQHAKERRKRLQAVGNDNDYISLSLTRRGKEQDDQGPHPESRLVREEDEIGEGEDEYAEYTSAQERIALGKKAIKKETERRRESMKELIHDAEEVDEETTEWENEQLRRGGHQIPDQPQRSKEVYKPTSIPPPTPLPTLAAALSRLTRQFSELTTSHANNTATLNSLALERNEVDDREKELRGMVGKAEEKRAWFESFRDWLDTVAGFLDEKFPLLEKLEEEHLSLLQERHDLVASRRRADDGDDLSTFFGTPVSSEKDLTETEFPSQRAHRRSARASRRGQQELEEGLSTDSELLTADELAYHAALENLASQRTEVLADVKAEDFKDPASQRWNVWRERYSDSYIGAWGGLGVVSVWEFWTRLECVGWNCIEDKRNLDAFKWYQRLYEYSHPDGEAQELGPEGDLVSSMVSTAIIPRISKSIDAGALDVYSSKHVKRVVDLIEEVEASVESGSLKLQLLFKSVVSAFERAVTVTEAMVGNYAAASRPSSFDPTSIPARKRFLARQLKLLQNILEWRKFTQERFGIGVVINRHVDGCIIRVADNGWDVGGKDVVAQVARILPRELLTSSIKNRVGM